MTTPREIYGVPQPPEPRGIECRKCGCRHFTVVYTRHREDKITRLRQCRHCGARVSTTERITG